MLTREDVIAWAARNYGPAHADRRVSDVGYACWVNTNSDAVLEGREPPVYGGLSILVLKRTGKYWYVSSNPDAQVVYDATDERGLRRVMRKAGLRPRQPDGTIEPAPPTQPPPAPPWEAEPYVAAPYDPTPQLTRERLADWLRVTRAWRHLDSRIIDLGWAFSVDTQPDDYHDGHRLAMTYGNGPLVVVKRNGAVWALTSEPAMVPAFGAGSEDDFYRILGDAFPHFDMNSPTEWIPR